MTSPPDKLFRQGLEDYQKPAPGSAWDRIESGLDRKRNRSPWMKIAAGLLIVIVTSAVILQFNRTDTSIATVSKESGPVSSQQSAVSSQQSTDGNQESVLLREASGVRREAFVNREASDVRREALNGDKAVIDNYTQESTSLQPRVYSPQSAVYSSERSADPAKGTAFESGPQSAVTNQNTISSDESNMSSSKDPVVKMTESKSASQATITNEISIAEAASDIKRSNITYTAEEVNAKYLKKESTAEATPEKKNTSGLQKVIDLALDLKNEGSVLGDIREKKNEWLSFNIPTNKRETNK